ncbi:MAG TPA: pirin family protein [Cellvibrio sp.]|nr:pirin family protein [Cellvibrio sp.]
MPHKPRSICLHADSDNKGPESHLITPRILGHRVKPFVSLEVIRTDEVSTSDEALLSSDSGTAIITFLISGEADFSDSTHKQGCLKKDDVLWMLSGSGIQYSLTPKTQDCISVKLRVALSPALESAPAQSIYLDAALVERDGPAQILLGQHGDANSQLALPALINYVVVTLAAGQAWIYEPPVNHRTAWIAVISGKIKTSDVLVASNEIAVYENSNKSISFQAEEDGVFLLGTSQQCSYQEDSHQEHLYQESTHNLALET